MMKYCIYTVLAVFALLTAFSSCKNEENDIFSKSAAERLNEISDIYSSRLADSKGGWVMEYYPGTDNENLVTGVGYLIMANFKDDGSVLTGMKNAATDKWVSIPENSNYEIWQKVSGPSIYVSDNSAWQVITDMGPVLSFNTYNQCFGRFTDPIDIEMTPSKYDDESGKGFQGDYEFVMVDVPEGGTHIMLKGKKRGIYQRMSRVPEGTDFENYLDDIKKFNDEHFPSNALWELTMVDGGKTYKLNQMSCGRPRVYPEDKDSVAYGWYMPYLVTKYEDRYHLRFKDTLMVEGRQMEQEFYYVPEEERFIGMTNAANTINPARPMAFFVKSIKEGHTWVFDTSSEMDGPIVTSLQTVMNDFAAHKYSITQMEIGLMEDVRVRIRLKNKNNSVNLIYLYDVEAEGETFRIAYREPNDNSSTQILNTVPSLIEFLNVFNGSYTGVNATGTAFNLRKLKLTGSSGSSVVMNVK